MFIKNLMILIVSICSISVLAEEIKITNINGGSEEFVNFKKIDEGESIYCRIESSSELFIKNLPIGASLNRISSNANFFEVWVFSWTPNLNQSGFYTIGFYTENFGEVFYKIIKIVVADTKFMITSEKEFSYLFTATDPDDDRVELTMTDLPTGATFIGSKFTPKIFTWIPTKDQIGIHKITLTATDTPIEGDAKKDVSIIEITVTLLPQESMPYDFNKDGKINLIDYSEFSQHWLKGTTNSNPVRPSPVRPSPVRPSPILSSLEENNDNVTVYKTKSGNKYHKIDCSYLKGEITPITIKYCKENKLTPCTRCKPDDKEYTSYSKKPLEDIINDMFLGVQ